MTGIYLASGPDASASTPKGFAPALTERAIEQAAEIRDFFLVFWFA
jgi:hypothetical protein